jgi:hypothetical protein
MSNEEYTKEELETLFNEQRERLLKEFPSDDFHCVADYGWGDGGMNGPFNAEEVIKEHFVHTRLPYKYKCDNSPNVLDFVQILTNILENNSGMIHTIIDGHYSSVPYCGGNKFWDSRS